jgi:NADPH-dependent curcumin reductase CurA
MAGGTVKHKQIVLAANPVGMVKETDFRVEETETELVVQPGSNDVAVKLSFLGVEPYYRGLMSTANELGFGSYSIGKVRHHQSPHRAMIPLLLNCLPLLKIEREM